MDIISVKNLVKKFKAGNQEIAVLNNISLSVAKGEFLSIMGPSGCGKSTLMYILGGLDTPSEGTVFIDDVNLNEISEKEKSCLRRRKLGFVFQFYNLVPNLSVEDNIMLPLALDGKKLINYKDNLNNILETIHLTEKRKSMPCELSGGQQQRVAIARALIFKPEIILADEPIGNLDSKTGKEIMKLFKDINLKYHTTIIEVTHSETASKYGTRIVYLNDGKIEQNIITASN